MQSGAAGRAHSAPPRPARASARPDADSRPRHSDRHLVRPALGHSVADAAAADGLWFGEHLLAPAGAVATHRGLAAAARDPARRTPPPRPPRPAVDRGR